MKKISGLVTVIAVTGILTAGLNTFTKSSNYVNRGDTGGAPARTDYINIAYGDYPAPAYNKADSHADFPAPQES